jgi:hypothetical protein
MVVVVVWNKKIKVLLTSLILNPSQIRTEKNNNNNNSNSINIIFFILKHPRDLLKIQTNLKFKFYFRSPPPHPPPPLSLSHPSQIKCFC